MKKLLLPIIIIALAVTVFILLKGSKPDTPVQSRPPTTFLVETQTVRFETLAPQLNLYGRIETPANSLLTAAIEANVEKIYHFEGEHVARGELLIALDTAEADLRFQQRQADVLEIQAQINTEQQQAKLNQKLKETQQTLFVLSQKAVERAETLQQRQLGSQALIDEATLALQQQQLSLQQLDFEIQNQPFRLAALQATLKRAKAHLAAAELDLQRAEIVAPFSGTIGKLHVAEANRVRIGDALMSLYDSSRLELRALIPEQYLPRILSQRVADSPLYALTTSADKSRFKFIRLAGEVNVNSGGREAIFSLDSDSALFAPGTFVSISLTLPPENKVIAVPFSAVYALNKLYVLVDGRMQSAPIEIMGEMTSEQGEPQLLIRSTALQEGDAIITTQLPNAMTGLAVESLNSND